MQLQLLVMKYSGSPSPFLFFPPKQCEICHIVLRVTLSLNTVSTNQDSQTLNAEGPGNQTIVTLPMFRPELIEFVHVVSCRHYPAEDDSQMSQCQ